MGKAPWIAAESAAVKVADWIALLNAQVFQASVAPNEALEAYWTEQFPARVRDALIVWVAHLQRPDLPRPEKLTAPPAAYAAYREATAMGSYVGPIAVVEATIFLPSSVNKLCGHNDALGRPALVTTTWALRNILDQINERCWQAGKAQQEAWLRASDGATLEIAAQDGWARLSKACDFANGNGVAIVVDQ